MTLVPAKTIRLQSAEKRASPAEQIGIRFFKIHVEPAQPVVFRIFFCTIQFLSKNHFVFQFQVEPAQLVFF